MGITDEYKIDAPLGSVIMNAPLNDVLSKPQMLPFAWTFYGSPVTHYRISDNGYITFDTATTKSDPNNTALPSPQAPLNSIFAFWDNLELSNNPTFIRNTVKTYTLGSAPNRIHVIQWNLAPLGQQANANYLYFALRIYEQGYFDIIYQRLYLSSCKVSGTVGCQNADGSLGTMLSGSPNFVYPDAILIYENVNVYCFRYGINKEYDAKMRNIEIPWIAHSNKSYNISGCLTNIGTRTIDSIDIAYNVDGGNTRICKIKNLKKKTNDTFNFTLNPPWTPSNPNHFQKLKAWISKINGNDDMNPINDTADATSFVNIGNTAPKKALIEEFSTNICGWCVDGHVVLENILATEPNIIGFTHHAGYRTDSMTIKASEDIAGKYTYGAPYACINRIKYKTEITTAVTRSTWKQRAKDASITNSPIGIEILNNLDAKARILKVKVKLSTIDYLYPLERRLNIFVIEDSVIGFGAGYDQSNFYNKTAGHPMYNRGDPIIGYVHRHVIRASLTGSWGIPVFEESGDPGLMFEREYTYQIPDSFKLKDMQVIAFVAYTGESDEIINSEESPNLIPLDIEETGKNKIEIIEIIQNPVTDISAIRINFSQPCYANLCLYDNMGNKIAAFLENHFVAGTYQLPQSSINLSNGLYILRLISGNTVISKKLIIMK